MKITRVTKCFECGVMHEAPYDNGSTAEVRCSDCAHDYLKSKEWLFRQAVPVIMNPPSLLTVSGNEILIRCENIIVNQEVTSEPS